MHHHHQTLCLLRLSLGRKREESCTIIIDDLGIGTMVVVDMGCGLPRWWRSTRMMMRVVGVLGVVIVGGNLIPNGVVDIVNIIW